MMIRHIEFTEHLVADGFWYAFGISTADINGDGIPDLVAADTNVGLYWFENDGKGNFARHTIHERTGEWLERHVIADINRDGRPEVVIVDNLNGSLLWFECNGDPRERTAWSHRYITKGGLPGAYEPAVADFDGDGDLDVAASSWIKGKRFAWFGNVDGQFLEHVIDDGIPETRAVCAVDVNGDGKIDLLTTAPEPGVVAWYENPGDPVHQPWIKHVIATATRPCHGHPVDMDGDGDVDVIMALGFGLKEPQRPGSHQIVWYENDGYPERGPWKKHIICEHFPDAFEAVAADLDGDGQMEVVATAEGPDGRIALFKHQGNPRGPWTMQMLKENWSKANSVFIVDLDGDGRPDIVASAERGANELRWWRNEGPNKS